MNNNNLNNSIDNLQSMGGSNPILMNNQNNTSSLPPGPINSGDMDDLNVDQELELEAQQRAAGDEEYLRIQQRLQQELAQQDSTMQARVQNIILNPNDDPVDDTPEVVEEIIQAVVGDPKDWNSPEAVDFFRLVQTRTSREWQEFQQQYPNVTRGEATRTLPPRYFAAPLQHAQMENLIAANKSPLRPNVGVVRARIHYRYKDGQSYSMLREFTFNQSAQSAIQEVVERVQIVLSLPSYGSPPASEFMFKVLGRHEFLYGNELMINFRYIRNCLMKNLDVELHVSRLPFPSAVLTQPRFIPTFGLSGVSHVSINNNPAEVARQRALSMQKPSLQQQQQQQGRSTTSPARSDDHPAGAGDSTYDPDLADLADGGGADGVLGSPLSNAAGGNQRKRGKSLGNNSFAANNNNSTNLNNLGLDDEDISLMNSLAKSKNTAGSTSLRSLKGAGGVSGLDTNLKVGISHVCSTWEEDHLDPAVSVWESAAFLEFCLNELRNLSLPRHRFKTEPLSLVAEPENAYVCVAVEVTFGGQRLTAPRRTAWTLCPQLLAPGGSQMASSASFNICCPGNIAFDIPISDLPREVRICCSVVGVRQSEFNKVKDATAALLLDDTETTQTNSNFAKLAALFGVGDENNEDKAQEKMPIFFIAGVNFQLLDHRGHLKTGSVEVRMWDAEDKWNPIGVSSSNPDNHAPAMRLELPDFAIPLVHPEGSVPPAYKQREMEFVHYENMRNLDMSIRDNKIAQLRMVKDVLSKDPLYTLKESEKILLWHFRHDLIKRPRALPKLLLAIDWRRPAAVHEGHQLMSKWAPMKPIDALELLDARFADTKIRSYAVSRLDTMPDFELANVLLQLVQVLKYEPYHYSALARFLLRRALQSPYAIGHVFFWHLKAEMYNTAVSDRHGLLLITYIRELQSRRDLLRQYSVDRLLLRTAMEVKNVKKSDRLEFLRTKLDKLKFPPSFSLPLNPTMKCSGLEVYKCKVMDSKKLPLWLVFRNADPAGKNIYVIFKAGDDLRQDLLTLQMLELMDSMWKASGLDLHMIPYGCIATGDGTGMIEVVLKSDTIAGITKASGGGPTAAFSPEPIMAWLRRHNRTPQQVESCLWNFLFSTAGYCVATYILGIGDRHNDNIMVREDGTLFHIDFGHFLGNFKTKFGIKRETAPFIFTKMYAHMLGGPESTIYAHFCDVACYAFNVIRRQSNLLITLFMLMLSTGIPELQRPEDIEWLKTVLMPDADDTAAAKHYRVLIQEALDNKRTLFNDYIHILAHS